MFKKFIIMLLLVSLVAAPVYAQDNGQYADEAPVVDVIGDITKAPDVKVEAEVSSVEPVNTLSKDMQDNIQDMKKIASDLLELAKEIKAIVPVKMANPDTEVIGDNTNDNFNLVARVQSLEVSVGKLEAGDLTPALDAKVRKIAVEEYEKIQLTIKAKDGTKAVKEVILSGREVQVNGYSGGFMLNPGETLVAVDGVPVNSIQYNDTNCSAVGVSNNTIVSARGLPNSGYMLNIVRPPARMFQKALSTCRMVNGVKVCN